MQIFITFLFLITEGETQTTAGANSINIPELENGKAYTFKVQTVDKKQKKSIGVTKEVPLYVLTETPTKVSTKTIDNKTFDIVKYGDWPQSVKADSVTLSENTTTVNNWTCYYGSDGAYYIKEKANLYYWQGTDNDPEKPDTKYKFDDGTPIDNGDEYYFKLEPIQWRVLTNDYNGKNLLFAEKALALCEFFPYSDGKATRKISEEKNTIYISNYEYSKIRAFLNGYDYINLDLTTNDIHKEKGFIQKAFTSNQINTISKTTVDNSYEQAFWFEENVKPENEENRVLSCSNTQDKLFLLSAKEMTNPNYGFGNISLSAAKTTDYVRAIGGLSFSDKTFNNAAWYWGRSPYKYGISSNTWSFVFTRYPSLYPDQATNSSYVSVVPALTISSYN